MLGIFHLEIVGDAAGKEHRSQITEVSGHAGEFGQSSLVAKEKPLNNRTDKVSVVF